MKVNLLLREFAQRTQPAGRGIGSCRSAAYRVAAMSLVIVVIVTVVAVVAVLALTGRMGAGPAGFRARSERDRDQIERERDLTGYTPKSGHRRDPAELRRPPDEGGLL